MGALLILLAFVGTGTLMAVLIRGNTQSQTVNLFGNLKVGLESGVAREVMSCVDDEYPFFLIWPELKDLASTGREAADLALRQVFMSQMLNPEVTRTLTYAIHSLRPLGEDRFEAVVSLELAVTGSRIGRVPPVQEIPFVLRRSGWLFPSMRIISHPRFTYVR